MIGNGLGYLENPDTVDYIIQDPRRFFIELRRRLVGPPTAACLPASSEANAGVEALLGGFFVFISASELLGTEGFGIGVPRTVVGCCRGEAKARRMIGENGSPWMSEAEAEAEAGGMKKQGLHFATLSVL